MQKIIIILAITAHICLMQAKSKTTDTLKTSVKEIRVTASKIESHPAAAFTSLKIISQAEIEQVGGGQVADVLSAAPGVFIKNLGGAGGLKTMSLRGTEPSQTLLLLDGMRLSSTQSGFLDLSILPMSIIEEIELVRGGASSLFGGNALGGVVNLRTRSNEGSRYGAAFSYGQYGDYQGSANFSYGSGKSSIFGNVEYTYSEGKYPLIVSQFGKDETVTRKNADFKNLTGFVSGSHNFSGWETSAKTLLRTTERGVPGAALQGRIESAKSRLFEDEAMLMLSTQKRISTFATLILGSMLKISDTRYSDSDALGPKRIGVDYLFVGRDFQFTSRYTRIYGRIIGETSAEYTFSDLRGKMLQLDAGGDVHRHSYALSQRLDYETSLDDEWKFGVNAASRFDNYSDIGSALSPSAGLVFRYLDGLASLRTNWSYNFRPPSFNEMYYLNYGSSDLKPERSHSANIGLFFNPDWYISLEAVAFFVSTSEQIIAVPTSPASWRAENVERVTTKGFEISGELKFFDELLNVRFTYTRQLATDESSGSLTKGKQLVYVPQELLSAGIFAGWEYFSIGLHTEYTSFRFALPDNSYLSMIPSFWKTDIFAVYKPNFAKGLELRGELSNLFDIQAAAIRSYPLPGRLFRISMKMNVLSN